MKKSDLASEIGVEIGIEEMSFDQIISPFSGFIATILLEPAMAKILPSL